MKVGSVSLKHQDAPLLALVNHQTVLAVLSELVDDDDDIFIVIWRLPRGI